MSCIGMSCIDDFVSGVIRVNNYYGWVKCKNIGGENIECRVPK